MSPSGGGLPAYWWRNADILLAQRQEHGTLERVAGVHREVSYQTLRVWWRKLGLPEFRPGPAVAPSAPAGPGEPQSDEWLLDAIKKLGDEATVEQLADQADEPPKRVRAAAERLVEAGYRITLGEVDQTVVLERVPPSRENLYPLSPKLFDGELVRVGVVSDTHLGSNEEALSELHLAYDIFQREGIAEVWHAGDIGCGVEVFGKKQHSESKVHTLDEQRRYVVENYPQRDGIVTRAIGGNHDLEGLAGKAGWDLVAAVANEREDIDYLGPFEAWLETRPGTGRWIHLLHGKGGMSYSYSYKAQRLVDSYPSGRKPSALIVGHWHVMGNITARDVEVLWPGCFEWQSQFMARLGLQPAVGFHILEMVVADDGSIVEFTPRKKRYFAGRKLGRAA